MENARVQSGLGLGYVIAITGQGVQENVEDQGQPSESRESQAQLVTVPWIVVFGVWIMDAQA